MLPGDTPPFHLNKFNRRHRESLLINIAKRFANSVLNIGGCDHPYDKSPNVLTNPRLTMGPQCAQSPIEGK